MRYLGGKSRLAKKIREQILARRGDRQTYWEPFVGGGVTFSDIAPAFSKAIASDIHEDLILMWQAVAEGWIPPEAVTEDEYKAIRASAPSALRGYVGFGCSFGGRWFGGFARCNDRKHSDPQAESFHVVTRQAPAFANATIRRMSYDELTPNSDWAVYCDPPYADTTRYNGVANFDHLAFWEAARKWADTGALVVVSEYSAPDDFVPVIEFKRRMTLSLEDNSSLVSEALFVHQSQVNVKRAIPA